MVIGRFNSITNSVPAGSIAERCLPSQCVTVTVAPTAPPMSNAFAAARQSTDEHSAAGSHANFGEIFAVVARAFELPFRVDVGAVAARWCQPARRSA